MQRFLLLVLLSSFSGHLWSQTSFSLSPDFVEGEKPASNFVLYNYGQFENLTDDVLQMRWVRTSLEVFDDFGQSQGTELGDWSISIQDPNTFFNPAIDVDSADFVLPEITGAPDKFILQMYPNGQSGNLVISFLVFPIDNPGDQITITFDYTITPVATAVSSPSISETWNVYPNPASDFLIIENREQSIHLVQLFSPEGVLLKTGSSRTMDVSDLSNGSYLLRLESAGAIFIKRIQIFK